MVIHLAAILGKLEARSCHTSALPLPSRLERIVKARDLGTTRGLGRSLGTQWLANRLQALGSWQCQVLTTWSGTCPIVKVIMDH